jgi:hypothetical protein
MELPLKTASVTSTPLSLRGPEQAALSRPGREERGSRSKARHLVQHHDAPAGSAIAAHVQVDRCASLATARDGFALITNFRGTAGALTIERPTISRIAPAHSTATTEFHSSQNLNAYSHPVHFLWKSPACPQLRRMALERYRNVAARGSHDGANQKTVRLDNACNDASHGVRGRNGAGEHASVGTLVRSVGRCKKRLHRLLRGGPHTCIRCQPDQANNCKQTALRCR